MPDRAKWMIYGANGYTGHLVALEAKRRGLQPVLAGRRAGPIQKLAAELGLPVQIFDVRDVASSTTTLADIAVVANCAGPFAATSGPTIDACLKSRTITGRPERTQQDKGCCRTSKTWKKRSQARTSPTVCDSFLQLLRRTATCLYRCCP
jgi:short subunit dehydrogenase-like uncharacterized protein